MADWIKYGITKIHNFTLYAADGTVITPNITLVPGDVLISINGGADSNVTNLPIIYGGGYSISLTAPETTSQRVRLTVADQAATKKWLDTTMYFETYGNLLAEHKFDLDAASVPQTGDTYPELTNKKWFFNADTAATNPTLNNIKVNNADPTLVTQIYVNNLAINGRNSITDILSLEVGDTVMMQVDGVGNTYMNFIVNGAIIDSGTWKTIPVSYDSNLGTINGGDLLNVELYNNAGGQDWTTGQLQNYLK